MITTSFFELFKIGPGPSSSHTMGPMLAANRFRQEVLDFLKKEKRNSPYTIRATLFGSLAQTGKGHGTHRALVAGLYGETPTSVDAQKLSTFFEADNKIFTIFFDDTKIVFAEEHIFFHFGKNPHKHPNTLSFSLWADEKKIIESVFYSVGGGFIEKEGEKQEMLRHQAPAYAYDNMREFIETIQASNKTAEEVLLENEKALTGLDETTIYRQVKEVLDAMHRSVQCGIGAEGILPGGLNLHRRAKEVYTHALALEAKGETAGALFARLNAYALATSEENAAGHIVVTAPTNGAAGIIPAALVYLRTDCRIPEAVLQKGMFIAGLIGYIAKHNASISGAELGCMAEVGVATAMAAALFTYCFGGDIYQISSAAEISIEHSLGMTCDPVKGLVQVPCIERNANGVIKAYNAYILAVSRHSTPLISLDQVIGVMQKTGTDLAEKYKETAQGGLASSFGWANMPGS